MAEDGKIYERNAIVEWLGHKTAPITSPVTRARMGKRLLPAIQTKNTISTLIKSGAIEGELARGVAEEAGRTKRQCNGVSGESGRRRRGGHVSARLVVTDMASTASRKTPRKPARGTSAAAARDPNGMAGFGGCLLCGIGGPKNTSLGWVYITDAAHLGSNVGAYLLGEAFLKGFHNLHKDSVQARFWLMKIVDGECKFKNPTEAAGRMLRRNAPAASAPGDEWTSKI